MFEIVREWITTAQKWIKPRPSRPEKSTTKESRRRVSASSREGAPYHSLRPEKTSVPHSHAVVDPNPPWEKGIISALRDLQWLARLNMKSVPGGFASFDWTAEQLGDAALDIDDRFYLVELKSSRSAKSRERIKSVGAYEALKRQIESPGSIKNAEKGKMLVLSMRCHHFVYWMDVDPFDRAARRVGALAFNPYLTDILSDIVGTSKSFKLTAETILMRMALGTDCGEPMRCYEYLNVVRLFNGSARILVRTMQLDGQPLCEEKKVGLKGDDFQIYIKFLVKAISGKSGEERPLRMILMAASGQLMRFISNTSELVAILNELKSKSVVSNNVQRPREEKKDWSWKPSDPKSSEEAEPQPNAAAGKKPVKKRGPGG